MATEAGKLGTQASGLLLTTTDGDISSATSGTEVKLGGAFSDVKFTILVSGSPNLVVDIEHSPDGTNWAVLGQFNSGSAITSTGLYVLTPSAGGATLSHVRLTVSSWTAGQIDQGNATVVQYVKNTGS